MKSNSKITTTIKHFILEHNVRPFFFIGMYAWAFIGIMITVKYNIWIALPCLILSGINILTLLIIVEND